MSKNKQMIFGISIGHFFNDLLVSFVPSMMFMLAISHKLTIVQQTLILAFLSFTSSMLQPVISKFVLFLGKKVLIFSVIWIAVFTSAISFTSSFLELFILVGLAGIASSIYHPVGSALTLNLSNKSKGFSLGLFMTVGGVAASFSPLFFAMMTKSGDFRKLLFIVPIGLIVAFIMYAFKTDELDFDFINKSSSRANHVEFCTYKWIGVLILLTTIRSVVYKVMLSFGVQVLTYEVISKSHLVFIFLLVSTLGTLIGGYVNDRIPSKLLFVVSNFSTMLTVMFFLMTTGLIQGIMFVLAALSLSMSNSSVLVIASEIFPENLILTNGLMMGLAAGLSGALLIIFGVFAEQVGLYNTIISLNILLLLASAYSLLIPKRGSKCRLSDLQYA